MLPLRHGGHRPGASPRCTPPPDPHRCCHGADRKVWMTGLRSMRAEIVLLAAQRASAVPAWNFSPNGVDGGPVPAMTRGYTTVRPKSPEVLIFMRMGPTTVMTLRG